jgi:hypothetical protein
VLCTLLSFSVGFAERKDALQLYMKTLSFSNYHLNCLNVLIDEQQSCKIFGVPGM